MRIPARTRGGPPDDEGAVLAVIAASGLVGVLLGMARTMEELAVLLHPLQHYVH